MELRESFPQDAFRSGDAQTGAGTNGKPVVVTDVMVDGTQYGIICFDWERAREIGHLVGLTDNTEKEAENRNLKFEVNRLKDLLRRAKEANIAVYAEID